MSSPKSTGQGPVGWLSCFFLIYLVAVWTLQVHDQLACTISLHDAHPYLDPLSEACQPPLQMHALREFGVNDRALNMEIISSPPSPRVHCYSSGLLVFSISQTCRTTHQPAIPSKPPGLLRDWGGCPVWAAARNPDCHGLVYGVFLGDALYNTAHHIWM